MLAGFITLVFSAFFAGVIKVHIAVSVFPAVGNHSRSAMTAKQFSRKQIRYASGFLSAERISVFSKFFLYCVERFFVYNLRIHIVANPAAEGKFSGILRVDYVFIKSFSDNFFTAYPIALLVEHLGYFFFRITVFVIVENKTDNFCLFFVNNDFLN